MAARKQRNAAVASSTVTWAGMDSASFHSRTSMTNTTTNNPKDSDKIFMNGQFSKNCYFDIARAMQQNLEVKDRLYHLKTYKNCFVGREAIDFLVSYLHLSSRQEAVLVAQELNNTVHCCEHVVHDHADQIKDDYLFYRFTDFTTKRSFTLEEVLRAFQMGVAVEDRQYRLRTYPKVFVGNQAIDFLVQFKFAASRKEAVALGRRLEDEYKLFVHVTGEHPLKDEHMFYRMLPPQIGLSAKEKKKREEQALKQWIAVFSFVALVIYYYLF